MTSERYLEGIHAIITGGSRGIGAAIAVALAARGARLTLMSRTLADLERHAHELKHTGNSVQCIACDVSDESSVQRAFQSAASGFGPAGILVNNAGTAISKRFAATTRSVWDQIMGVNLTGTYLCSTQVMPGMMTAQSGRIVNIASVAGLRGYKTLTAYCAAKHGVIGFTRALALESAKHGITVNAVCPGYTDTDLTETGVHNIVTAFGKTAEEARAMLVAANPRGIMTTSEEVAAAVSWLCAPSSAAVNGIALPIAGGEVG